MDMRSAIKQITGKDPTDQQIQKILAIAQALDMPARDPMIAILAMLDTYHGVYTDLPGKVSKSVSDIAKNAANIAESDMITAVAQLVPTVSKAVSDAAQNTMDRVQIGKTMWTFLGAALVMGVLFIIGFLCGADIWGSYLNNILTLSEVWSAIKWGVAAGLSLPALVVLTMYLWTDYRTDGQNVLLWCSASAAIVIFAVMSFQMGDLLLTLIYAPK